MKKVLAVLLVSLMIVSVTACGGNGITGTWEVEKVQINGSEFTVSEVEALGESIKGLDMVMIIKDGGSACVSSEGESALAEWTLEDTILTVGKRDGVFKDGRIYFETKKGTIIMKKTSNSQVVPNAEKPSEEPEEMDEPTEKPSNTNAPAEATENPQNHETSTKGSYNTDANTKVEKEYTYTTGSGTYRILIVKNISDKNISISTNTAAYDIDGSLIGAEKDSATALAPNSTVMITEHYDDISINKYETTITSEETSKSTIPLKDFTYEKTVLKDKVIVQGTYNGELDEISVTFNVIFFKDGKPIDTGWGFDDYSKGITMTSQINCWDEFDSVEVYPSGYGWNW